MIRMLKDIEKLNITPLFNDSFDNTEGFRKYFYEEIVPKINIAVDVENDDIRSMLCLIEKPVTIGKSSEHCYYIYGVATDKRYRKCGLMSGLLKECLKSLRENGEIFTYLMPDQYDYIFEKYGFTYVCDRLNIRKKEIRKKPTHSIIKRSASRKDFERLAIFAQATMESRHSVFITRDKKYFQNMYNLMNAEHGYIDLYFKDRIILGYRIGIGNDIIEEILDNSIEEMSLLTAKSQPSVMARIIDIKKTMNYLKAKGVGNTVIKLYDSLLKENEGTYLWKYNNGRQSFEKTEMQPRIEMDISELTAHVFGYVKNPMLPEMEQNTSFLINDYL